MSTEKSYKRKKFFNFSIKKKLQFHMLIKIWVIILASLLITSAIFYFYSDINVGNSYRQFHVKADNFLDFLLPVLITGFFASLVLGVVAALFFPHSFAGPIYRIEREIIDIGKGNLGKKIRLRKGDGVTDLTGAINTMAAQLRSRIEIISELSKEIGELIKKSDSDREGPAENLRKINVMNENIQQVLREFKL